METEPLVWPTRKAQNGEPIRNSISSEILTLELDEDEERLFASLCEAANALRDGLVKGYEKRQVIVRVAGGWVRDKILGISTHDVDVALDTCTGVEFASIVKTACENSSSSCSGRIGVIAANPAQSKHLETATMKVHGIEIDFSNLRHETYADDSRIPTAAIGTPVEDSFRRDFTMNALYYNLQTRQVEDWTRRGLKDLLETKLVVTPLDAHQTFHDDPLRVLRAIRFSVRFNMQLVDEVQEAAKNPQIHQELHRKVSRERVGKELEGMLSGKHADPISALTSICDLQLAGSVFCLPPASSTPIYGNIGQQNLKPVPYSPGESTAHLRQVAWLEARECLTTLQKLISAVVFPSSSQTPIDQRLIYLATTLLPYEYLQYEEKNKNKLVVEYMLREGIKFKNKDCQGLVSLVTNLDGMTQLLQCVPEATPTLRLQAGLILRGTKHLWTTLLMIATVSLIRRTPNEETNWATRCYDWYQMIVEGLDLEGCWTTKALMNGKELMEALKLNKGPTVGVYNQEQIQWMLMNPHGTLDECKTHLRAFQKRQVSEQDESAEHIAKRMHL